MKFVDVYEYEFVDGKKIKKVVKDIIGVQYTENEFRIMEFFISEGFPTLPLKKFGEFWYRGWDIPTCWAIDSDNQTWIGDGHGNVLCKCSNERLIRSAEEFNDKVLICEALGVKPPQPKWYKIAISEGWTPPEGLVVE